MKGRYLSWGGAVAAICVALVAASSAGASGAANTFTVTGFADGAGSCAAAPDANGNIACPTLRAAVSRAGLQANTPTIYLQAGTFQLDLASGGQLLLKTGMNIVGAGAGGPSGTTVQQTDGQDRVFEVRGGPATLTDLEVTGGRGAQVASLGCSTAAWAGGGILAEATLDLTDVFVTGNQAVAPPGPSGSEADCAQGGGIAYTAGGGTIVDSTITGNSVTGGAGGSGGSGGQAFGGGIADVGTGSLVVKGTTIADNTATGGTGTSSGNGGSASGGGIYVLGNGSSAAQLVNSTVFGNGTQGGAAASGGGSGTATGGGIYVQGGPIAQAVLQSDTIDANQAGAAGNLSVAVGGFTVHDTIVAGGTPDNCAITTPASSESNNLEDDAAGHCGFSAASHDLLGANPQLPSSLGANGGPTETLAPAPGSPVLRAGGACVDPTSSPPNQALATDQRGQPRPAPCDIGAFQGQSPRDTVAPLVSGRVVRGQTLICSQGTWTGDGTFTFSFAWLRNGAVIPGDTTNTYVVAPADAGQTLACRVTATYYGSTSVASPFVVVPSLPVITVLKVTTSPGSVVVILGCRGPDLTRCVGSLQVSVVETLRGRSVIAVAAAARKSRTVVLGQRRYSILARHIATIRVALKQNTSALLSRFATLPVMLKVSQTTALGTKTVSRRLKISSRKTGGAGA